MTEKMEHHLGEDLAAMADEGRGLAPLRREELAKHVSDCAECRAALRSAKLVLEAVEADRPPEPSPAFDRALFARLDALDREAPRATLLQRLAELFTFPRLGAAV